MKILNAIPGFGPLLSKNQVIEFLSRKLNLQLGTIDDNGDPNINPVWFFYENEKIYIATSKQSKKAHNALQRNQVYFSIDDETYPYKGVKGKGIITALEDFDTKLTIAEKIIIKYMGNLENDIGKHIIGQIKNGNETILEITPKFYSAWSFEI